MEVLRWIADGCPDGSLLTASTKLRAVGLANRKLVTVTRGKAGWRASITTAGEFYLKHGRYEPPPPTPVKDPPQATRSGGVTEVLARGVRKSGAPLPKPLMESETVQRILKADQRFRVPAAARSKLNLRRHVIYKQETTMRFQVRITRVQVATRNVTATDPEAAAAKLREELDKPYGLYASWETVGSEIEVIQAEEVRNITPVNLTREGPMLIALSEAARATGVSYGILSDLANKGDIEQVRVGKRRYLKRQSVLDFIERNTLRGHVY